MPAPKLSALIAILAAMLFSACGGADEASTTTISEVPGGADPEEVEVIASWAEATSSGDSEAAGALFAVPSIAQNGVTVRIESASDAERFSASLPCAATLEEAVPEGEYVIATFRLGERANSTACGAGAGETARTAFLIEDGKIAEWRRIANEGDQPASGTPA